MKGYLKTSEGAFMLRNKSTTVGRHEDSDLCLQTGGVEEHHALIEFSDLEGSFVLRDFNSYHGSFVNDCRIQNAAVRLAPGDVLRFGFEGPSYELVVENTPSLSCPPVSQRTAWQGHLQIIKDPRLPPSPAPLSQLPSLQSQPSSSAPWTQGGPPGAIPHPPIRTRPASAGNRRGGTLVNSVEYGVPSLRTGNWTSSAGVGRAFTNGSQSLSPQALELLLQEKEQRLLRQGDEVSRLQVFEGESRRKDAVIASLRDEIAALKQQLAQVRGDTDIIHTLKTLESKKEEIQELKEQMIKLQTGSSEVLRHAFSERDLEISSLKNENERLRRDSSMSAGLVTSLQRDISAREQQVTRLGGEVEKLHKQIREKDIQLASMSAKFSNRRETKKHEEELVARETEVVALKKCLQQMDQRVKELEADTEKHHSEADRLAQDRQAQARLQEELERGRQQLQETGLQEQLTRVQLEQTQARLERFRSRIIQTTYTAPGVPAPNEAVSDQEVIEQMTKIIEERAQLKEVVRELQKQLEGKTSELDERAANADKLKNTLEECQTRLKEARLTPALKREVEALQQLCVDPSLSWVQRVAVEMLLREVSWQQEVEQALQDAGIDVLSNTEGILGCIKKLWQRHQEAEDKSSALQARLEELQGSQDALLQEREEMLMKEHENQRQDELKRLKEAAEEQSQQCLEEAVRVERERMAEERRKLEVMESHYRELTELMAAKSQEEETLKSRQNELTQALESARKTEVALRAEVEEERKKQREETAQYREQVRQHSCTIVALEDRLLKLSQQQGALEVERTALRDRLREAEKKLESRQPAPTAPPTPAPSAPAIPPQLVALRAGLAEAQREILSQRDVIVRLSSDLARANARMSDMTGELSEKQKMELEQNRAIVRDQRTELSTLRKQLAGMSELVEKKKAELQSAVEELRHCKADLERQQIILNEKESQCEKLEEEPKGEERDSQRPGHTEERIATTDLADQGTKCRGHRHEEVIQRQREALAELRERIKTLEQTRPLLSSQEQAVQQVAIMRRELAELRAQQAISDNQNQGTVFGSSWLTKTSEGHPPGGMSEAAVERTSRLDLSEALDLSERTYLDLVRALASLLNVGDLPGSSSLKHAPPDERERLISQRHTDLELLHTRLRLLQSQLERKEELLSGYQRDLEQLRQSQDVVHRQQVEVDRLREELQGQSQESALLREALDRAQQRLDQEKRLNKAIKERKTFHLEQLEKRSVKTPPHSCVQEDMRGKAEAKKAALQGKLKKKGYEIETLKKQLSKQDQELCSTTTKLVNLQNALGVK
ncbi:forkhead-associated domain-containing protein 1-like [Polyodon spathula]|uniref:forkhead-associated domain-containing protein 1-like n=1 Tax=Polyodon spathula TaxID=7913 RepID=UPI001B7E0BB1|nr:forkhead-associated domain-containing protein 1-like [Polyodon spathula]